MKLHEVKKNERIYIAKKVPGKTLDQLKFISYRTKHNKTYFMEQCKPITEVAINKSAIWMPKHGMGIYSRVLNINIDGDKNMIGYTTKGFDAAYMVIEEGDYIALVEPVTQMKFFVNISREDY